MFILINIEDSQHCFKYPRSFLYEEAKIEMIQVTILINVNFKMNFSAFENNF